MDPRVTLRLVEEYLQENNWEEARYLLHAFIDWRNRGGYASEEMNQKAVQLRDAIRNSRMSH